MRAILSILLISSQAIASHATAAEVDGVKLAERLRIGATELVLNGAGLRKRSTTTFAGVGDQEIVLALVAVRSGESMREDAAFEIAAEGSLDMGRRCFTVLSAGLLQPGFEMGLDDAIPQRLLGTAALVALGCGRGALSMA